MMRNVTVLIFSIFLAISADFAMALTCKSGDAGCSSSTNTATDCTNLGYSNTDVANCKHYIYCPFNQNYKSCVAGIDVEPTPPVADCSDYPLTECPTNGICEDCPDDNSYKKLSGCELGYTLNTSKTGCELSISCTDQYKELNQLAAVAEKSYFNCCKSTASDASNVCRTFKNNSTDGCLSKRNGAWDDGCFSYFEKIIDNDPDLEIGTDFSTITEAITACKAKLQNIKDAISSHNYICPNNKITDNINTDNCNHVWFKGDTFGDIDKNLSVDYRGCPEGYSGTGGK